VTEVINTTTKSIQHTIIPLSAIIPKK